MQNRIVGTSMPVLEILLEPNDAIISEAGELSWMSGNVQMTTHTQMGGGGGLFGAIRRVAGGGSLFMTEYRPYGGTGESCLRYSRSRPHRSCRHHERPRTDDPSPRIPLRHAADHARCRLSAIARRRHLRRRRLPYSSGSAVSVLPGWNSPAKSSSRSCARREIIRVHPGHVGAFEAAVAFQITTVPGIRNMIFGGDGIFLAQLTGPGKVWLQTLPISRLAHALVPYMPSLAAERTEGGVVGGIIGSVLGGR